VKGDKRKQGGKCDPMACFLKDQEINQDRFCKIEKKEKKLSNGKGKKAEWNK
jgi:hypothetical protein